MSTEPIQHIAIIGGGFSGTMTLVNLVRLCGVPLKITLFNHGYPPGRGVAYSTRNSAHLLNVAARNMSALPDHPGHFVEWLRTRTEFRDVLEADLREMFVPRALYGDYLRGLLLHYSHTLGRRATIETAIIEEEVVNISANGDSAAVTLADGRMIPADKVVLATGNETPAEIPGAELLGQKDGYAANPWQDWTATLPATSSAAIVLLGTGLTTVDAIVTLLALGWAGPIHAVSRHGLLPQAHFKGVDFPDFPPPGVDLEKLGLAGLVSLLETYCQRLRDRGENPAITVDRMRPHTQRIWQALSNEERRTFVAKHAARWNASRHRIAPGIHAQVTAAIERGQLRIVHGSITRLEARTDGLRCICKVARPPVQRKAPTSTGAWW